MPKERIYSGFSPATIIFIVSLAALQGGCTMTCYKDYLAAKMDADRWETNAKEQLKRYKGKVIEAEQATLRLKVRTTEFLAANDTIQMRDKTIHGLSADITNLNGQVNRLERIVDQLRKRDRQATKLEHLNASLNEEVICARKNIFHLTAHVADVRDSLALLLSTNDTDTIIASLPAKLSKKKMVSRGLSLIAFFAFFASWVGAQVYAWHRRMAIKRNVRRRLS